MLVIGGIASGWVALPRCEPQRRGRGLIAFHLEITGSRSAAVQYLQKHAE